MLAIRTTPHMCLTSVCMRKIFIYLLFHECRWTCLAYQCACELRAQIWFFCNTNHGELYLEISIHSSTHQVKYTKLVIVNREIKEEKRMKKWIKMNAVHVSRMCVCECWNAERTASTLNWMEVAAQLPLKIKFCKIYMWANRGVMQ